MSIMLFLLPVDQYSSQLIFSTVLKVLRILASIPDDYQQKRITYMLLCMEKPNQSADHGAGLLVAARAIHSSRPSQHYNSDIHYAFDRYVLVTKELTHIKAIPHWLYENRQHWSFMERELLDSQQHQNVQVHHHGQMRGNYNGREPEATSIPLDHHHHSDSDMAGVNDSEEEEDDDSRFEEMETYQDVPSEIIVEGAGQPAVNGVYQRDGYFESACKYSMHGKYKNEACIFSLFQCNVSNNTKHWYISIVPRNSQPGTSTDIDFYSAPVIDNCREYPPAGTWTKSNEGRDPPPKLMFKESTPRHDPTVSPGGVEVEDDGTHPGRTYI